MATQDDLTINHPVVSHEEWLDARRALLEQEKAFTRHSIWCQMGATRTVAPPTGSADATSTIDSAAGAPPARTQ